MKHKSLKHSKVLEFKLKFYLKTYEFKIFSLKNKKAENLVSKLKRQTKC